MSDYFDNLPDEAARRSARANYAYNELVLRAPPLSLGANLSKAVHSADALLGSRATDRLASLLARPLMRRRSRMPELPESYIIMHNDIFCVPFRFRRKKLANGHYLWLFNNKYVGIMACRRGAYEAELQADALGQLGVRKILFIGTCLRVSKEPSDAMIVVPDNYRSELGRANPAFPPLTTSATIRNSLISGLESEGIPFAVGDAYIAHRFVLEEGPENLVSIANSGVAAVEMEGIGFASGIARHEGEFASALIGLDHFAPDVPIKPLNTHTDMYLYAARATKRLLKIALKAL